MQILHSVSPHNSIDLLSYKSNLKWLGAQINPSLHTVVFTGDCIECRVLEGTASPVERLSTAGERERESCHCCYLLSILLYEFQYNLEGTTVQTSVLADVLLDAATSRDIIA